MSLLSAVLLPILEKEFLSLEPIAAQFLLSQLKNAGKEIIEWAESKMNLDINGDGKIGESK